MIPPLVRRCPDCGFFGLATQFAVRDADGDRVVECPACHYRFRPTDKPWLN